jgi:hypothetical protein
VIAKNLCDNDWKSILLGISSSSLVVFVIETVASIKDYYRLANLSRTYKRIKITNTLDNRHPNGIYEDMTQRYIDKGVGTKISLTYKGDGEYVGEAFYEEGKVILTIYLDKTNPKTGTGTYQYLEKNPEYEMPDLGKYIIQIDNKNTDTVFVYYSNIVPNGLARGYEIWEK